MGQPIKHPAGYQVKITRPLDFMAVTDHAEYAGMIPLANDPNSAISKLPIAEKLKVRSKEDIMRVYVFLIGDSLPRTSQSRNWRIPKWRVASGSRSSRLRTSITSRESLRPSRPTSGLRRRDNRNMHRNIIFKDSKKVPEIPFLRWTRIILRISGTGWTRQRKAGNELLAISHNANLSDGIMFPLEVDSKSRPIDAAWAQERVNNEPLTEIHQLKGTSETHPLLSPNDEFADYEITELPSRRGGTDSQNPRQLHPRGMAERPGDAGQPRLQPIQDGSRWRERLAQHGCRL